MNETLRRAARTWDRLAERLSDRTRYWHSPALSQLVRERFVEATGCVSAAELLARYTGRACFQHGISIGCGAASEELWLLQHNVVERFTLADISAVQRDLVQQGAAALNIDPERLSLCSEINMTRVHPDAPDLVYWRSSLHHMANTEAAILWSLESLREGGAMYCNDYCGPNRLQWTQEMMDEACWFRAAIGSDHPLGMMSVADWLAIDPTEAADSESILPALRRHAPQTRIWLLGGVIYHLALNEILADLDDERDLPLLRLGMLVDRLLAERGLTHFFASVTKKGI